MAGWLYIIGPHTNDYFKVGFTEDDPIVRMRAIQVNCPFKLFLICAISCAEPRTFEKWMHSLMDSHATAIEGEWYELPRVELLDAIVHLMAGICTARGVFRFKSSSTEYVP